MTGPGLDISTRDDRAAIERLEQNIARPMGADTRASCGSRIDTDIAC